jgi:Carboxypeptidase regulatory-like domain
LKQAHQDQNESSRPPCSLQLSSLPTAPTLLIIAAETVGMMASQKLEGRGARVRRVVATSVVVIALSAFTSGAFAQEVTGAVVDDRKMPLSSAEVRFDPGSKSDTTDANGAFSISDLADGDYSVTIRVGDSPAQTVQGVKVRSGRLDPNPLTIKSAPPAVAVTAPGRVVDREGIALNQVKVVFGANLEFWTKEDGTFTFEGAAGEYKVTIDGTEQKTPAQVESGRLRPDPLVKD